LAKLAAVKPTAPDASGLFQVGLDHGDRLHRHRADQVRWMQLAEMADGEEQEPGRQDERGGQRCHIPTDEQSS
jgi:hypothetical protein